MSNRARVSFSVLKGKQVLVTGGSGFIGSHLVRLLIKEGARVSVVSRDRNPWRLPKAGVARFRASVSSKSDMRRIVRKVAPEIVFHLAAPIPSRGPSQRELAQSIEKGTRVVAEVSAAYGVKKLVVLGSAAEYGRSPSPINEAARVGVTTPYGEAKRRATAFLKTFAKRADLSIAVVRPPIVYGPVQSFGMLIPDCITAGIKGKDFPMGNPALSRDFLFVDDLALFLVRVASHARKGFEIFNAGSGKGVSVGQVAKMIERDVGKSAYVRFGERTFSSKEALDQWLSIEKARRTFGWRPQTSLSRGLRSTVQWYRKNKKLFRKLSV